VVQPCHIGVSVCVHVHTREYGGKISPFGEISARVLIIGIGSVPVAASTSILHKIISSIEY
jgi:hypothetical protein